MAVQWGLPLPTLADFEARLLSASPAILARDFLLDEQTYVFRAKPELYDRLRELLAKGISVQPNRIRLVGSGKTGFSMKPRVFPRAFSADSDLDIAVIDQDSFELIWTTLLVWSYPRRNRSLPAVDYRWLRDRQNDIYWGWMYPTKIRYAGLSLPAELKPMRDLSATWFNAFQSVGRDSDLAKWPLRARLYRSEDQFLAYHADGIRQLQEIRRAIGASA
jgi:hypothetical protein